MVTVSVLMSVYREKPEYLRLAINSILSQTYTDFEFIIVLDDPENINAHLILDKYKEIDKRIRIFENKHNLGLPASLNQAIKISKGKYLARMDADDISLPERFEKQVDYMEKYPNIAVLGTNKNIMDENGNLISKGGPLPETHEDIIKVIKYSNIIIHPSVMMRKESIVSIGGYRNLLTAEDYDLWCRVITSGLKICNLNEFLINYRINPEGITMSKAYRQALTDEYIKKLTKERIKTGSDSFSKENLLTFLLQNKIDDPKITGRYQKAKSLIEEGRIELKRFHIWEGIIKLLSAGKMHPLMKKQIKNDILSALLKRRIL